MSWAAILHIEKWQNTLIRCQAVNIICTGVDFRLLTYHIPPSILTANLGSALTHSRGLDARVAASLNYVCIKDSCADCNLRQDRFDSRRS